MSDKTENNDTPQGDGESVPPSDTRIKQSKPPLLLTTTVKRTVDPKEKGWDRER